MEWISIGIFFSLILSWAFMADAEMLDWDNLTTWLLAICCIPGILITIALLSPTILLHFLGDKLNVYGKRYWIKDKKDDTTG